MKLFDDKKECCACEACRIACPQKAITMDEDEYGFLYPQIDRSLCVECGICYEVCTYKSHTVINKPIVAYVGASKNMKQRMNSASGGIFAAIASQVLDRKGVVFGAALERVEDQLVPHHIYITDCKELYKLQGSKYVHCRAENTYQQAKEFLKQGREVLFSGTPCQIAGLQGYLGKEYEKLITVDIICHGVPNAKMFNEYLKIQKKRYKAANINNYLFRDKKCGWGMNSRMEMTLLNGKSKCIKRPARTSSYFTFFLDGEIYRENCYSCKYACEHHPGDITIGDYWGIEREHPELLKQEIYDTKSGISAVIVNTKKGKAFLNHCHQEIQMDLTTFEQVKKKNGQLTAPSSYSERRNEIFNAYQIDGFKGVDTYFYKKFKKQIVIHTIYNLLPRKVRLLIKQIEI